MSTAKTISIEEIFRGNYQFVVKSYQRGYRWEKSQVEHLIDDMSSFMGSQYCLQPIIVKKIIDNKYELVDGQQRLTTLWILKALHYSLYDSNQSEEWYNFTIEYESKKPLSLILNDKLMPYFKEQHNLNDLLQADLYELFAPVRDDDTNTQFIEDQSPDIDYIISNLKNIIDYSRNLPNGRSKNINSFLGDIFNIVGEESRSDKIKIIWYELVNEDSIDVFSTVNANKIRLTESELIKAKMLSTYGQDKSKRNKISLEWESIERGLCDDGFWRFLSGRSEEETRIDLIFKIWLISENCGRQSNLGSDYPIYDYVDEKTTKLENVDSIWLKICDIYYTLHDWYENNTIFHLLGLLNTISNEKPETIISNLYSGTWETTQDLINETKDKLENCIAQILHIDNECNMIESIKELKYGADNDKIKKVLLCYNISILVNSQNPYERFPFDLYFKDKYDIEHINPKSNLQDGNDSTSIGNLVLLDQNTNRCDAYKTGSFSTKRKIIADILRHGKRTESTSDGVQTKYVPIGTRWVFLDVMSAQNQDADVDEWSGQEKYIDDIASNINKMINNDENISEDSENNDD